MLSRGICLEASLLSFLVACSHKSPATGAPGATASASSPSLSSAAAVSSASATPAPAPPVGSARYALPSGPRLAIQAGAGVGPIRIGATVATIERLMEAPCEIKTADACRYIARAVEFELKGGVTERIVVHRHERPAGPDAEGKPQIYGFFNGGIPPDLGFGMIPAAIRQALGEPQKVEQVTVANDFSTVERDTYPGLLLEYDRYTNGNLILGGAIITKLKK